MPSENTKNTCSENNCENNCENCCGNCQEHDTLVGDAKWEDFEVPKTAFVIIAQTVLATIGVKLFTVLDPTEHGAIVFLLRDSLKNSGQLLNYDMSNYIVGNEEPVEMEKLNE